MSPAAWRNVQTAVLLIAYLVNGWLALVASFGPGNALRMAAMHVLALILCLIGIVRLERQRSRLAMANASHG